MAVKKAAPKKAPSKKDELLSALIHGLSPIPYWIGYKHERFPTRDLPELAIGAEFRETLSAALDRTHRARCEYSYRNLGLTAADLGQKKGKKKKGRPDQADLVVMLRVERAERPVAAIEIKRSNTINGGGLTDLRYLKKVRLRSNGGIRAFLILVTEGGKPKDVVNANGTANREVVLKKFNGELKVRRVLRAVGHATKPAGHLPDRVSKEPKAQHWAVLIEVK